MRVTQNMMVRNAIRWMLNQTEKLNDISTVVAAGKQVNKPSDDPDTAGQILEDRTTLSKYAKYIANISEADTWIETSNTTLESIHSLLETAQEIIGSVDSQDSDSADRYLEQLEGIYDQIIDLANTKLNSTYLYGGNNSLTCPFADEVRVSGGTASDVVFALAGDVSDVTVEITNLADDVVRTLTLSSGGSQGPNNVAWDGLDDDGDLLADGTYEFTVSATDSDGKAVAAYAAYRGNEGGKELLLGGKSAAVLNNDGSIFSDALSSLSQAITVLKKSTYTDDLASELGESIEKAMKLITEEQVTLANVTSQLEIFDERLGNLTLAVQSEISILEVGCTEEAAVKLEAQTTAREVTLEAVANILKMSKLSDYV
ncbi:MAG: FlgD immunoglobulin-like domain containing protein [Syntrophales bacterium]|nr:FlgD immunoglobulin-like domain containing protein [Syntrophales bacterium]